MQHVPFVFIDLHEHQVTKLFSYFWSILKDIYTKPSDMFTWWEHDA